MLGRLVVAGGRQRVGQAGVGVGGRRCREARSSTYWRSSVGAERAVEADADDRLRVASEFQKASRSGPTACGPEASVMVPEIITGRPNRGPNSFSIEHRLGVQRVEDGLDQQDVGPARPPGRFAEA